MNPLESLAKALASPKESAALQAAIAANPITISFDPHNPQLAIRTDARTGARERGRIDDAGIFYQSRSPLDGLHAGVN